MPGVWSQILQKMVYLFISSAFEKHIITLISINTPPLFLISYYKPSPLLIFSFLPLLSTKFRFPLSPGTFLVPYSSPSPSWHSFTSLPTSPTSRPWVPRSCSPQTLLPWWVAQVVTQGGPVLWLHSITHLGSRKTVSPSSGPCWSMLKSSMLLKTFCSSFTVIETD